MEFCSKIRWYSVFLNILLIAFLTIPMLVVGLKALSHLTLPNVALFLFVVPIGLIPAHLLLVAKLKVCFTQNTIIIKKFFGFWKKEYTYDEVKSFKSDSYARSKGSSKRYRTINVLFSDGNVYRFDEANIANYQQVKDRLLSANPNIKEQSVYPSGGFKIWLTYILIAFLGGGGLLIFLKLTK
ncbi:MAG: hypothetical protein SFU27_00145 [Thermonemataceae bacterium]|nr:hypothetical protein [Thermonemataceae bacterium]